MDHPVPEARKDSRPGLSPWLPPVSLALLAVLTFAAGLSGGFVLDDKYAILQHPVVRGAAPLGDLLRLNFWGESLTADPPSFRPLTTLSFVVDQHLLGGSALAFHVSSLLWFIGLVVAGWFFARRCLGPAAGFVAMAFFVVMPVHVENVASVAGRADTLGVLFTLLACLALWPVPVVSKVTATWRIALAALAFLAAMLSKESMAAFPIIVALFVEYRRPSGSLRSALKAHVPSLVMASALALYLVARLRLQPRTFSYVALDDVLVGANVWEKIGYGLELLWRYGGLILAPTRLCTGRKFAEVFRPEHLSLAMIAGMGLLGLAGYLSWRAYRRRAFPFVPAALMAWFLITGLVFAMPESMADRFLLLPSLFLCFAVGPRLLSLWQKGAIGPSVVLAAIGVQVLLSGLQARTWRDDGTLFSHAVQVCPNSLHNHFNYAEYLSAQGQAAEAAWHYGVVSRGKHFFPYAWSHPALEEERSLPAEQRVRRMHDLLGFKVAEPIWRVRFEAYLRSMGRQREADLIAASGP